MADNYENEMTYRVKSGAVKKLNNQIRQISNEASLQQQLKQIQKLQQIHLARLNSTDHNISRVNAVKLMRKYEKLHIQSEKKLKECQKEMATLEDLAHRYHDLYIQEKNSSGNKISRSENQTNTTPQQKGEKEHKTKGRPSTVGGHEARSNRSQPKTFQMLQNHLDDNEAKFQRQVARMVDSKSILKCGPIRVEDVMRKNETLLLENEKLRLEVERLRFDNSQLILKCKRAEEYKSDILNHMTTSDANRIQLMNRLDKEQRKNNVLNRSLTQTTAEWIQAEQRIEKEIREARQRKNDSFNVLNGDDRTNCHPTKKNSDKPRQMYPVEKYASANQN